MAIEKTILGLPVGRRRPVRAWYWWLLLPLIVWMAREALVSPPALATLAVDDTTLVRPLELVRPTGKGHGGPYVLVALDCALSPELASLSAGQRVRVWHAGERIWQLARPGHADALVAYASIVRAYNRNRFWTGVMIALVTGIFWWRWRTERQDG